MCRLGPQIELAGKDLARTILILDAEVIQMPLLLSFVAVLVEEGIYRLVCGVHESGIERGPTAVVGTDDLVLVV